MMVLLAQGEASTDPLAHFFTPEMLTVAALFAAAFLLGTMACYLAREKGYPPGLWFLGAFCTAGIGAFRYWCSLLFLAPSIPSLWLAASALLSISVLIVIAGLPTACQVIPGP